jgi:hypothetical protein
MVEESSKVVVNLSRVFSSPMVESGHKHWAIRKHPRNCRLDKSIAVKPRGARIQDEKVFIAKTN